MESGEDGRNGLPSCSKFGYKPKVFSIYPLDIEEGVFIAYVEHVSGAGIDVYWTGCQFFSHLCLHSHAILQLGFPCICIIICNNYVAVCTFFFLERTIT